MAIVKKISELTPKGSNLGTTDLLIVGVDNGTDYDLKSVTGAQLLGTVVSQTITNGVTTKSPSEDIVYDNLALKVDKVVGSRLITSAESTILGNTSGTNTGDQDLSGYVKTTTNQTIGDEKTFSSNTVHDNGLKIKHGTSSSSIGYTGIGANVNSLNIGLVGASQTLTFPTSANFNYTLPSATGTLSLTSDLTSKVDANIAITGATKTKITYDSKGLVTSGADATTSDIADSLNKRYVTDANLTVIGNTSGTNTGDQIISDATISLTDITTNNFDTTKHGFVPKGTNTGKFLKDDGTWGTPSSGSSGGIWGIANASGVYTYYATWALAVAAATSGKVIELFADITESSVSYTLKNGVNINGNGHSVSFSVVDGFVATSSPTICEINNIVVNQATASVNGLYINAVGSIIGGNATFNSNNASSNGVYGRVVTRIYGFTCNGYSPISSVNFFSPNAVIDNVYVNSLGGSGLTTGTLSNSIISSSSTSYPAVSGVGTVNNCYIYGNGYSPVEAALEINNSTIISTVSRAINSNTTLNNCWVKSLANTVFGAGTFNNCTLIGSTTALNSYLGGGNFNNCTLIANASAVLSAYGSGLISNCNVICNYNNAGGHAFSGCNGTVTNSVIQVANSSAFAFTGTNTMYLSNNGIKGTTNFKSAGITNAQTNTADAQGNVILQ